MPEGQVLRLLRFRPSHAAFDRTLREVVLPDLRRQPGLVDVHIGRQGPDELGSRLVATVWTTYGAMIDAFGEGLAKPMLHPELLAETIAHELDCMRIVISVPSAASADGRILRVFRGRVRLGDREGYVDLVRQGFLGDIAAGIGPTALHLATGPAEDEFTTVSVWNSWSAIESATGGDVLRPMATRHPEHIVEWDVAHYELIEP